MAHILSSSNATPFAPVAISPIDTKASSIVNANNVASTVAWAGSGLPETTTFGAREMQTTIFKPLSKTEWRQGIPCIHPKAVIFDLDGTLLNTAPDIIEACNATLKHYGFAPISLELGLSKVTAGMRTLLRLGIPEEKQAQIDIDGKMRDYFAQYYLDHICEQTKPFDGILELLHDLHQAGVKLAVVTNKYENMTYKLLKNFAFYSDLQVILGCDSIIHSKPHPEPILKTIEALQIDPFDTLYVGDHLNDIKSANQAKTRSAIALWGYGIKECGDPESWHAHFMLPSVKDLRTLTLGN